tara:strand:- start:487 stop:1218 length:732 start_codon:yes stop_codon:yes gene_type:complete
MATYASLRYNIGTQLTGECPEAAFADDAVTLAKMAHGTDGNLIGYDASGNPAAIAAGTSGQVLTSAGAGSASAFVNSTASGKIVAHYTDTSTAVGEIVCPAVTHADNNTQGYELFSLDITPVNAAGTMILFSTCFTFSEGGNWSDKGSYIVTRGSTCVTGSGVYNNPIHGHGSVGDGFIGAIQDSFDYTGWTGAETLRVGIGFANTIPFGDPATGVVYLQVTDIGSWISGSQHQLNVLEVDTS